MRLKKKAHWKDHDKDKKKLVCVSPEAELHALHFLAPKNLICKLVRANTYWPVLLNYMAKFYIYGIISSTNNPMKYAKFLSLFTKLTKRD